MALLSILIAFIISVNAVDGCGGSIPANVALAEPTVLWTICCADYLNNSVYACVNRNDADADNPTHSCSYSIDHEIVYLECLGYSSQPCTIQYDAPNIKVNYKGKFYDTKWVNGFAKLVLLQNRVTRTKFFVKTREQMRNFMTERLSANNGDNNYWIGLDMLNFLSLLQLKRTLNVYVNSSTKNIRVNYNHFQVDNSANKFTLNIGLYIGPPLESKFLLSNLSTFNGTSDFSGTFCDLHKTQKAAAWWYGIKYDKATNSYLTCSDTILTTDDGFSGWGDAPITGSLLTLSFRQIVEN